MKSIDEKGYIAVTLILIVISVVFVIGTSVSVLSINDIQMSLANKNGLDALNIVEGCVENSLLNLNEDNNIPSSISLPEGNCSVTINSQNGNDWDFTVQTTIKSYSKSIRVNATRATNVLVTAWTEN
ncbi:MAG TPA: hypothetical protein VJ455_02035 [Ignavibacteria bacterium]|uniref:Type 4 fimbrial biogenesis protein PilX N-terminal domain-containing protein n=1 Tax=candidate division WWE3 bacterium RIFCSPHIGHO2_02_FULL_38_14 TaxID=1802620 RepID=A0A1F4V613_UNCKA|nr:MAG: hypothetical protein A2793_00105 [candidate division WWE3 bacterium RIFCSPHIGHO2_01_FULL_38_45]OGC52601.1 MAG: hypothetical protein A3D91_01185 [candidate division WWE3 bacterium RIFCSPHIGHO2_02_FULL_38_14]OGC53892.1 MAG: hypothetical protein A3B64_00155 [candidate division WWE3 bacterium RIFCSPLOWO2_01_FULL_37_24]HJY62909.1 hypothetical protein [Ignavibacteria bacterium]